MEAGDLHGDKPLLPEAGVNCQCIGKRSLHSIGIAIQAIFSAVACARISSRHQVEERIMIATGKLVGARVKRTEDPRLVTGNGNYVGGMKMPGMVDMAILRSPEAHARILGIDVSAAQALPGVRLVLTGEDLRRHAKPQRAGLDRERNPTCKECDWYALASDTVRYCGEGVAAVVADNRYIAEDALALIEVDYEPLAVVIDPVAAMQPDAPLVHPEWGDNLMCYNEFTAGDVDGSFAAAHTVVKQRFRTGRNHAVPLEPRAYLARFDAVTDELTMWASTQMPHLVRTELAAHLNHPESKIRVIAPDVGGGFGLKGHFYQEELITAVAAMQLGLPVRWLEDRREAFTASYHAKEQIIDGELALDRNGKLLAARYRAISDVGAYNAYPWTSVLEMLHGAQMFPGPYHLQHYAFWATAVATNKSTISVYRGVGAPLCNLVMEGLLDMAAIELGLDPLEIRRRNLIRKDQFPYAAINGLVYEEGSYLQSLEDAAARFDYTGFRRRQGELRTQGVYRGVGISCYNEVTGPGSSFWHPFGIQISGYEASNIKIDPSGHVTVYVGTHSHGQAHETIYAQIAADELGIPFERITVRLGDTGDLPYGWGTWASRAAVIGGGAVIGASQKLVTKIKRIAGHLLEAAPEDIVLAEGEARIKGVPGGGISIAELARKSLYSSAGGLPPGEEPGLDVTHYFEPPRVTVPNAVHIAEVEVDVETGQVVILRYVVIEDCGRMINPMVVDGQITGGVAQGLGGAMFEQLLYDEQGQPLTTSFMDYLLPSAPDVPFIEIGHLETPSPHVPGGFKGCGEGGAIAPFGALANAVSDALAPFGVRVAELPITPDRVRALVIAGG
ncbi:MAG: xanthine dehydrogenase family protein molybdopterin-binding subunit [Gammaproteobacteria bacterium]|nr:xanthine dehydrogenase family protein molybdopterin-binding subunit [Gammaproteobacteria bacterium]